MQSLNVRLSDHVKSTNRRSKISRQKNHTTGGVTCGVLPCFEGMITNTVQKAA